MKVFILDDSEVVVERLVSLLSELPELKIVGKAGNPEEALASIQKTGPDVVILDIRLKRGNGIHVLKEIKKKKQPPLAIMLTNYSHPHFRKKCLEAGADYFFDKSTEFDQVTVVLAKLIAAHRSSRRTSKRVKL